MTTPRTLGEERMTMLMMLHVKMTTLGKCLTEDVGIWYPFSAIMFVKDLVILKAAKSVCINLASLVIELVTRRSTNRGEVKWFSYGYASYTNPNYENRIATS